ncbi:MAG: T9SS type A sorting domain-containing protein [Candidatus Kapabacteria bacterium]|nr:T9SS type A sorting domain-containing protein [Candidatus Kapabacteria bacterium]
MKKIYFTIILLFLFNVRVNAHQQWVHQYIVQEAYRYLERHIGPIPALKSYVGIDAMGNPFFGAGQINRPFEHQHPLAVGIWQEDEIDAVWRYYGLGGSTITTTHFWSAQGGDDVMTDFPALTIGDRENAYLKARIYMFNGEHFYDIHGITVNGNYSVEGRFPSSWQIIRKNVYAVQLEYNNLCNLINTGIHSVPYGIILTSVPSLQGDKIYLTANSSNFFSTDKAKTIGWNIFGRILHLLTDMGVPAHTHADTHPCPLDDGDFYELQMGTSIGHGISCSNPVLNHWGTNWTAKSASQHGGLLYEVFSLNDKDALRYLFYTMNRLSAHFASKDENGNDWLANGNSMLVSHRYIDLGITGTKKEDVYSAFEYTGDELMNYAIRATATAMYWMAIKTGLVGCPETVYQQSHTYYGMRNYNEECVIKAASNIIAGSNVNSNLSDAQGSVIVEDGTLTYKAGQEIQLKPGFHAKEGSTFRAMIDNSCPLTNQVCSYSSTPKEQNDNILKNMREKTVLTLLPDTMSLTAIASLRNTSIRQVGDTIIVDSFLKVIEYHRPTYTDTTTGNYLFDYPVIYYTDSVELYSEQDSLYFEGDDSLLVSIPCFSKVILTDSVAYIIPYCTGISIKPNNEAPSIRAIYPNPNSSYIDVALDNKGAQTKVMIYSPEGIKLSETMVGNLQNQVRMSTQSLAAGTYVIIVQSEKGTTSKTFVIQR